MKTTALTEAKLNLSKQKAGSGRFYAIRLGDGSGLFCSFRSPHQAKPPNYIYLFY